jgi:hypothetical protein
MLWYPRRIVQIATGGIDNNDTLALADDGTLWRLRGDGSPEEGWVVVPGLPNTTNKPPSPQGNSDNADNRPA